VNPHPDWTVRRSEMIVWLSHVRECISARAPESIRKRNALRLLDGWLEDLPLFAMLMH